MYTSFLLSILSALRPVYIVALLLLGAMQEGYGQTKVYATNYGAAESGPGLVIIVPVLSPGLVENPGNAVEPNALNGNFARLIIGGLAGNAYSHLQLKFINNTQNLPAGTSIYIQIDGNTSSGLLGLLLASDGFISAQQNAAPGNLTSQGNLSAITGQSIALTTDHIESVTINGNSYLKITPPECFNAITISITSAGLLGLLTSANLQVYHAYYECPEIIIPEPDPICVGETVNLAIENPFSCGEYGWYDAPIDGSLLHTGTSYSPIPTETTTYYVQYSGIDASRCGRSPVTITVHPIPTITLQPIPAICEGETTAILAYSDPTDDPDQYSIIWDTGTPSGFTNVTDAPLPNSPIALTIPATTEIGTYTGILSVKNSTTGCESEGIPFEVQVLSQPGKPHLTITDIQN